MPAHQPFTLLCQSTARSRPPLAPPSKGGDGGGADLHVHTTHSDGSYTPAEVVNLARRSGLAAVAITDHDTLDGIDEARSALEGAALEVVSGVEITAEYADREFHLLGYFVRTDDVPLQAALARLRAHRRGRFWEMVARLRACGVELDEARLRADSGSGTLGRRNLANLLVEARQAGSVREAFARYLGDAGRAVVPKLRLEVAEALALVRGAGGVAAWAHPSYDECKPERLRELRTLGLGAVEVDYPGRRPAHRRILRGLVAELGLAVTGGSDCHGPEPLSRALGSCGVTAGELESLRRLSAG